MADKSSAMSIPMENITVDYDFNIRSRHGKKGEEHYRGIEALAADIKKDGLLNPVTVRPIGDGKFSLVAGFRRMEAMKILDSKFIDATIRDLDPARAAILNAKENTSRDNISVFDFAKRCVELRDKHGMTQAKIAAEFAAGTDYEGEGMSRSYIGNLMRAVDKLHPDILNAWKEEDPSLSVALLVKWGALEHEEQMEEWEELRGGSEDEGDGEETAEEGGSSENKKATPRKASTGHLVAAYRAVKNDTKLSETTRDAMEACFQFAIGKTKTLRIGTHVIYDPKAEKVKAKAEKDEKKAEKSKKKE